MTDAQVMVSVICNAYNHEKYIKQCLDGLVMQKTDFVFEILVHDDASTDKTADIIRTYEQRYPELIKPVYQTENQYSKGGIYQFQYPRAQGKYIALCEGDDYWTDEYKLQKQVDALESHPEIDICTHGADVVSEDEAHPVGTICPRNQQCVIPVEAVIYGGGAFVATNSIMYRSHLKSTAYEFRNMWRIDYSLQILGSLRGGMLYIPEKMSAYRRMAVGSWTARQSTSWDKRKTTLDKIKRMLMCLDKETEHQYASTIERTIVKEEYMFYYLNGPYRMALAKKYKAIRKRKPFKEKVKLWVKVMLPFLFHK